MHQVTINVYNYSELQPGAQERAINEYLSLGIDEWWENLYDHAESIGMKITSSDEYKVTADFTLDNPDIAANIVEQYADTEPEPASLLQDALNYQKARKKLLIPSSSDLNPELNEAEHEAEYDFDCDFECEDDYESAQEEALEDLDDDFRHDLQEDFRILLIKEYEYITSTECIEEIFETNEYTFLEDGSIHFS